MYIYIYTHIHTYIAFRTPLIISKLSPSIIRKYKEEQQYMHIHTYYTDPSLSREDL